MATFTETFSALLERENSLNFPRESLHYIFKRGAWFCVASLVSAPDERTRGEWFRFLTEKVAASERPRATRRPSERLLDVEGGWLEERAGAGKKLTEREAAVPRRFFYAGARYFLDAARGSHPLGSTRFDRTAYEAAKLEVARARGYTRAPDDWYEGIDPDAWKTKLQ